MRLSRRRLVCGTLAFALFLLVMGCGNTGGTDVRRVALVTPGKLNDVDWTVRPREAFEAVVVDMGVTGVVLDASTGRDLPAVLDQAADDAQLVIAHEATYADAAAAAAERTGVAQLLWGSDELREPGRLANVDVDAAGAGYVAGVLAGKGAYTKRLGIVICDDGSPWASRVWTELAGGFVEGARSLDEGVSFAYARIEGDGGVVTTAQARTAARRMLAEGTQTILGLGGRAATGMLREVARAGGEHGFVGAIGDKGILNLHRTLVTAVEFELDRTYRQAIADVRKGSFGDRSYSLSLRNGGLTVMTTGRNPQDAQTLAEAAHRELDAGELRPPRVSTPEGLEGLLDEFR